MGEGDWGWFSRERESETVEEGEMSDFAYCAVALMANPRIETRYTDEETILQDFEFQLFRSDDTEVRFAFHNPS